MTIPHVIRLMILVLYIATRCRFRGVAARGIGGRTSRSNQSSAGHRANRNAGKGSA